MGLVKRKLKGRVAGVAIVGVAVIGVYSLLRGQSSEQPPRSVWDGVYSEEQAKRGDELSRRECAACHGDGLTGGEAAPPLVGGAFLANWDGLTVGDLFERIRKTMPQDDPKRLSSQQDADILAYMLRLNDFPTGKTELERRAELLKQIRLEAAKPEKKK